MWQMCYEWCRVSEETVLSQTSQLKVRRVRKDVRKAETGGKQGGQEGISLTDNVDERRQW